MGKKEVCPKCHQEFKWSAKEKAERFTVEKLLAAIKVEGLEQSKKETEGACYDCWKKGFRTLMKPYAVMLGKNAEGW